MSDYLARLRTVAEAATQEPWQRCGRTGVHTPWGRCVATTEMYGEQRRHDADHIAMFDPPTVLALLAVAETARELATVPRCCEDCYEDGCQGRDTTSCPCRYSCHGAVDGERRNVQAALARLRETGEQP